MQFAELLAPPCYDWYPDGVAKEAKRLARDVAAFEKKRAKVKELAEVTKDLASDRTAYLRACIDAGEAELKLRDELVVFLFATDRVAAELRRRADEKVRAVVAKRRAELGIPEATAVPLAVLQTSAAWWKARRELGETPDLNSTDCRREHEQKSAALEEELERLKSALAGEAKRRATFLATRQREEEFVPAGKEEYDARWEAARDIEQRAAALAK